MECDGRVTKDQMASFISKITGSTYESAYTELGKRNAIKKGEKQIPGRIDFHSLVNFNGAGCPSSHEVINFMMNTTGRDYEGCFHELNRYPHVGTGNIICPPPLMF